MVKALAALTFRRLGPLISYQPARAVNVVRRPPPTRFFGRAAASVGASKNTPGLVGRKNRAGNKSILNRSGEGVSTFKMLGYIPPGPVAVRFMRSDAKVRLLNGPIGSGKTSACLLDLFFRAQRQAPDATGTRRFKFAVIRDTFRQLEKTTIPSWHRWFPKELGKWTGGEGGRPGVHDMKFTLADATALELTVEFIGLGENKAEDAMRGWEGTAAYLNEADLLAEEVLTYVLGRVGRFPPVEGAHGPSWRGVVLDCNAPDVESWIYKRFVEQPVEGWEFFRQPSGLSAQAENVANLPGGYYEQQIAGQPDWYVRRFVRNEFGYSREGKPVYAEFNDARHVAPAPLMPMRGLPLVIGLDAGLTPAGVVLQRMPDGQWRALDEVVTAPSESVGPQRFAERLNRVLAEPRYRAVMADGRAPALVAWCDPSAGYGADKEAGELTWIEKVEHETEIGIRPAPTQELNARFESVRRNLARTIDGTAPGLLISPACRVLRKGFNSGYRFRRIQLAGQERYDEKPEKNEWSHVHDALQYGLLGGGEFAEVTGRRERRERASATSPARADSEYDPLAW